MTAKLLGADDASGSNVAANYFRLTRWQAVASGYMAEFRIKAGESGNIKCALYADNSGQPGALITAMNTGQAVVPGWNTLTFTPTAITSGTYYWLATCIDTTGAEQHVNAAGKHRLKVQTYSTFTFPNPAGSGFDAYANYYELTAGWEGTAQTITPSGISQAISIGEPAVSLGSTEQTITPTSIVQSIAIGTPTLLYPQTIAPSSITQPIIYGTPQLNLTLQILGALQPITTGEPEIQQGGAAQTITPTGIEQAVAVGEPVMTYPQDIATSGIEQAIACGTPKLVLTDNTFEAIIENLLPETTYVFRAVAKNSAGQGEGETLEFTTPATPLPPANLKKVLVTHPAIKSVAVIQDGSEATKYENLSNLDEQRIEDAIEFPVLAPATIKVTTLSNEVWTFDITT